MAAYRRVNGSRHLQADCQEPGSAPEPYARQSRMGYLYVFTDGHCRSVSCIDLFLAQAAPADDRRSFMESASVWRRAAAAGVARHTVPPRSRPARSPGQRRRHKAESRRLEPHSKSNPNITTVSVRSTVRLRLLTLSAYAERSLCNGRMSVHLSVPPIDSGSRRVCCFGRYRSIAAYRLQVRSAANAGSVTLRAEERGGSTQTCSLLTLRWVISGGINMAV